MPEPFSCDEPNFGVFSHLLRSGVYGSVNIEVIYGTDLERVFAGVIGATRAFGRRRFGADMATQWYGGNQHDELWKARCRSSYFHAFLRGANPIFSEHGIMDYKAMGKDYGFDHPAVKYDRDVLAQTAAYAAAHPRAGDLPDVAVAAIQGRFDGYVGAWQTHLWGKRKDERFRIGDPDRAWQLFDGLYRRNLWEDRNQQGDVDYSGNPPLGTAEIMPYDAPDAIYAQHHTLFFLGRNVMNRDLYDRLVRYVKGGGTLILAATHLDTADSPMQPFTPFNGGDWSELVGLKVRPGEETRMSYGIKFTDDVPKGWKVNSWGPVCDPWFTDGGYRMPAFENAGAKPMAVLAERFGDKTLEGHLPALFVHALGKGQVVFLPTLDSPGAPGSKPLYAYLLARAMEAVDVWPKVGCSDRVRWSSYDGGRCLYLLNTEPGLSSEVVLRRHREDPGERIVLAPGEFKEVRKK